MRSNFGNFGTYSESIRLQYCTLLLGFQSNELRKIKTCSMLQPEILDEVARHDLHLYFGKVETDTLPLHSVKENCMKYYTLYSNFSNR